MANVIAAPARWTLQPYLLAGVGAIRVRGCVEDCVRTLTKTEFGLDAGGGAQYRFSDVVAVRGELRYFRILSQIEDLPRTASGSFDFFRLSGGVTLMWGEP
jgi:opacity protein-like surface antigen